MSAKTQRAASVRMHHDMEHFPKNVDLSLLGLDPSDVTCPVLIRQKHSHCLYRIMQGGRSFVLKLFAEQASEVECYRLLAELGVPTLPVHGYTENALLLEDIATSQTWRLADAEDMQRPETGKAVATWYRTLHSAGRKRVRNGANIPRFLKREMDDLNPEAIMEIGRGLSLGGNPVWKLAAEHIEVLKRAMRALNETLNYNDFHWTNLALSQNSTELRAVVYDYHLMGIGPAYCDFRNVVGTLGDAATRAFRETYGPVDAKEKILDDATAPLYALSVALQRPHFPKWAQSLRQMAESGELKIRIQRALEICDDLS